MKLLCAALSRYWTISLALALSITGAGCVYTAAHPDVYTAESSVAIVSRPEQPVSASLVQLTAPTYVAYATSEHLLRNVSEEMHIDRSALRDGADIQLQPATTTITISVTLPHAANAQSASNAIADAIQHASRDDPSVQATLVAAATLPLSASGPPRTAWIAASVLLGAVLAVILARTLWWWSDVPTASRVPAARRELSTYRVPLRS